MEIKAYDYMLRFERDFNGFETVGNAYAFLALCCKACNVELAHTQAEIEAMPNGAEMLSVYTDNDIETYRDVLFYVAADHKEQTGMASGTIVVPVPSVSEDGGETAVDVSVEAELPVRISLDGKDAASVKYEFNDEEILIHHPAETWCSGRHVLPLYYPIENLIPNYANTFNVYLRMESGTAQIETGGCIASISGQGMAAALELVQREIADSMGMVSIGAFGYVVDIG